MDEDALNISVRRFLKKVGITSQREIETAVRDAESRGDLPAAERLPVSVTLRCEALGIEHEVHGEIDVRE
jgi:hypothetical protein